MDENFGISGPDLPFFSAHHRSYEQGGIIDSAAIDFSVPQTTNRLRKMTRYYEAVNRGYEKAFSLGATTYAGLGKVAPWLAPDEKKIVWNKLRSPRYAIIPIRVHIEEMKPPVREPMPVCPAEVVTVEYKSLPIMDFEDMPAGLKIGYLMRFKNARSDKKYFRIGWKVRGR
jgi:hypothetical protein